MSATVPTLGSTTVPTIVEFDLLTERVADLEIVTDDSPIHAKFGTLETRVVVLESVIDDSPTYTEVNALNARVIVLEKATPGGGPSQEDFDLLDTRVVVLETRVDDSPTYAELGTLNTRVVALETVVDDSPTYVEVDALNARVVALCNASQSAQDAVITALKTRIDALEQLRMSGTIDMTVNDVPVYKQANFDLTVNNDMPGSMIALVIRETVPTPLLVAVPPPTQNVESPDGNPIAVTWPPHNTTGGAQVTGGIGPYQIIYTPTRGSNFSVGTTQVTIDVTSADNQTRQGFFNVVVAYTTPPPPPPPPSPLTITGPNQVTAFSSNGSPVAVTFAATVTGGLQPYSFTYFEGAVQKFSGNSFAVGNHTIDITASDSQVPPVTDTASFVLSVLNVGSAHTFFNTLVARGDLFKAYSLRPVAGQPISSVHYANQLLAPAQGGYAATGSQALWVTYNPGADTDPDAVDGAKVIIPAWRSGPGIANAMAASTTGAIEDVIFNGVVNMDVGAAIKIGSEIITKANPTPAGTLVSIKRGQYGTTAAAHSAGSAATWSINSLMNTVRLPISSSGEKTLDGNTYFFTWDVLFASSYLATGLTNLKQFQFSGSGDIVWFQIESPFNGGAGGVVCSGWNPATYVLGVQARAAQGSGGNADWTLTNGNLWGPGITSRTPILPMAGTFCVLPNVWTRYFVRIQHKANDYDTTDMWVADETRGPVQIYANLLPSVIPGSGAGANTIWKFWLEFNTSTQLYTRGNSRDLVAYMRNWVALKNPSDVSSLITVRPVAL